MSTTFLLRRCAAVSAAFVLACGAAGVAASAALADTAPPSPAASASPAPSSSAEPTASPQDPTFTLTNNGAGSFSLALTIPGTSITIDYTLDAAGSVTAASTSTAGASVTGGGHDLKVMLADGRVVKVELGDTDEVVKMTVHQDNGKHNGIRTDDANDGQHADNPDPADSPEPGATGTDNGTDDANDGQRGDNSDPADSPEPHASATARPSQESGEDQGDSGPTVVTVAPQIGASASTTTHRGRHDQPVVGGSLSTDLAGEGGDGGSDD